MLQLALLLGRKQRLEEAQVQLLLRQPRGGARRRVGPQRGVGACRGGERTRGVATALGWPRQRLFRPFRLRVGEASRLRAGHATAAVAAATAVHAVATDAEHPNPLRWDSVWRCEHWVDSAPALCAARRWRAAPVAAALPLLVRARRPGRHAHAAAHLRWKSAAREGGVDLDEPAQAEDLTLLERRRGRGRPHEAAESVQSEALGRDAAAPLLLKLGPLPVKLDAAGCDLAEHQERLCNLRLGRVRRHAHEHDGVGADAALRRRHGTVELSAWPRHVAPVALLAKGKVDVSAVGALPVTRR
mmetsp:Transcript_14614/g.43765  ORF Transcript_14614/g.43765 Transcript_14614/m.43765 type:complete len:301 (-) Transcript_14614:1974-2876(-)